MSRLYIRKKSGLWLNFANDKEALKELECNLIPERRIVVADLSTFTKPMRFMLLKMLEEYPDILDCYSSVDIDDPILLSRFTEVIKEPLMINEGSDDDAWKSAKHDYMNVQQLKGDCTMDVKLRLPICNRLVEKLVQI